MSEIKETMIDTSTRPDFTIGRIAFSKDQDSRERGCGSIIIMTIFFYDRSELVYQFIDLCAALYNQPKNIRFKSNVQDMNFLYGKTIKSITFRNGQCDESLFDTSLDVFTHSVLHEYPYRNCIDLIDSDGVKHQIAIFSEDMCEIESTLMFGGETSCVSYNSMVLGA